MVNTKAIIRPPRRFRVNRITLLLGFLVVFMGLPAGAQAGPGWFSWLGDFFSLVARVAELAPVPHAKVVGQALEVLEVAAHKVDQLINPPPSPPSPPYTPPYQPPYVPKSPDVPPASAHPMSSPPTSSVGGLLDNGFFLHITSPHLTEAGIVATTNAVVDQFNSLTTDYRSGNSDNFHGDYIALSSAVGSLGDQYNALGVAISVSQSEISTVTSLPASEIDYLLGSGISAANVAAYENYVFSTPIFVSGDVSVSNVIHTLAKDFAPVPEPSSIFLMLAGATAIVGHFALSRRKALENPTGSRPRTSCRHKFIEIE